MLAGFPAFRAPGRIGVAGAALAFALAGCMETGAGSSADTALSTPTTESAPAPRAAISDEFVPAPEEFDATGLTIWDGARTLQGIWVAHPLANTARRVRITNPENGRTIDGALFRRDATLAGPSVLISSEAAQALGLQPGVPTEILVVAVEPAPERTVAEAAPETQSEAGLEPETASVPESAPDSAPEAEAVAETEPAAETETLAAADPVAEAVAEPSAEPVAETVAAETTPEAAEAAEAPTFSFEPAAEPVEEPAPEAEPEIATVSAIEPVADAVPAPEPEAEPEADREATPDTGLAATANPIAGAPPMPEDAFTLDTAPELEPEPEIAALPEPQPEPELELEPQPEPEAPAVVEPEPAAQPIAAIAPEAAGSDDSTLPEGAVMLPAEPAPPAAPAAARAAEPAPEPVSAPEPEPAPIPAGAPALAFIQAGTFSVAGNAERLVSRLKADGLPARALPSQIGGRSVTRVVIGPFDAPESRDAALRKVRSMGLPDAIPVRG